MSDGLIVYVYPNARLWFLDGEFPEKPNGDGPPASAPKAPGPIKSKFARLYRPKK